MGRSILPFCSFFAGQTHLLVKEQRLRLLALFCQLYSMSYVLCKVVGFGGWKFDTNAGYRSVRPISDDLNIAQITTSFNTIHAHLAVQSIFQTGSSASQIKRNLHTQSRSDSTIFQFCGVLIPGPREQSISLPTSCWCIMDDVDLVIPDGQAMDASREAGIMSSSA